MARIGSSVSGFSASPEAPATSHFATPEEFRDYLKINYGPTIAAYRALEEDRERVAALDRDLADVGRRFDLGRNGATILEWEYLLVTARVR